MMMRRSFLALWVGVLLLTWLLLVPAIADEATTRPPALAQIGYVAGKSTEALAAFAKLAGFDLPPQLSADGIEGQFSFIGKGGVATDEPIGVALVGGPGTNATPDQMEVFVIPIKTAAATPAMLKAAGALPLPDHPGILMVGVTAVHRGGGYVLISQNPAALAAVNADTIVEAVKDGDALAKASVDLMAVRNNMPEQYQMLSGLLSNGGGDRNSAAIAAPVVRAFQTLDRVELGLDNGEKGVRFSVSAKPAKLPPLATGNRFGMPPGVVGRADLGLALGEAIPGARDMFNTITFLTKESHSRLDKPLSDEQKKQIDLFMQEVARLELEPASMSVGVEMIGADPVVYIAQHWSRPIDATAEVQSASATFNRILAATEPTSSVVLQTYLSGSVKVLRLVAMDGKLPQGYVDVAQRGSDVYFTICPNPYRYIQRLLDAKDDGAINSALVASIDLAKLVNVLAAPGGVLANLPETTRGKLKDLVNGQTLSVSETNAGDVATVEIMASKRLVQNAPKVLSLLGFGSGDARK